MILYCLDPQVFISWVEAGIFLIVNIGIKHILYFNFNTQNQTILGFINSTQDKCMFNWLIPHICIFIDTESTNDKSGHSVCR